MGRPHPLLAGLSALLVALSEGERWGWLSAATLGVFALSVVVLCLWVWVELHVDQPMVEIGMMRDRAVLWTNIVAMIAGFAMFGTFLLVPSFVQMGANLPDSIASQIDYGFSASVIVAGLYLLPGVRRDADRRPGGRHPRGPDRRQGAHSASDRPCSASAG